ncbi:hypothetical protein GDO81_003232 [Engystomops pustulosus]|uniref:Transmembrane protein n=1 Tax=Engystomops pustulosus TaxID=76066 RepID=A0AAV6ZZQ8_ENGPU|nr:hypothetical protein GDO81_003232 [Engystomops pustulosus]
MAAQKSITKTALWSLAVFAILSLHSADAQNCTYNNHHVPDWAIAIIVMVALLLLAMLCSCGIVPLMCKRGGNDCGGGCGCMGN